MRVVLRTSGRLGKGAGHLRRMIGSGCNGNMFPTMHSTRPSNHARIQALPIKVRCVLCVPLSQARTSASALNLLDLRQGSLTALMCFDSVIDEHNPLGAPNMRMSDI